MTTLPDATLTVTHSDEYGLDVVLRVRGGSTVTVTKTLGRDATIDVDAFADQWNGLRKAGEELARSFDEQIHTADDVDEIAGTLRNDEELIARFMRWVS
jgi:hypothetical protein